MVKIHIWGRRSGLRRVCRTCCIVLELLMRICHRRCDSSALMVAMDVVGTAAGVIVDNFGCIRMGTQGTMDNCMMQNAVRPWVPE